MRSDLPQRTYKVGILCKDAWISCGDSDGMVSSLSGACDVLQNHSTETPTRSRDFASLLATMVFPVALAWSAISDSHSCKAKHAGLMHNFGHWLRQAGNG